MQNANTHATPLDNDFVFARYFLKNINQHYCISYLSAAKMWIVGFFDENGIDYEFPPEVFSDFTDAAKFYLTQIFDGQDEAIENYLNNLHNPPLDPIDGVFD